MWREERESQASYQTERKNEKEVRTINQKGKTVNQKVKNIEYVACE